ncbi:ABC transporter substrate-binding protein [Aquincola sp. S2]|uniref:ABC transporter substrate-binding protein n=1 Tax=Pseudaquabacterium terrae TaxID=2732868 RepID=A0ABX2EQ10_9BURK|nr:ABC transporter substrate-binding protein [Aquabacterium terrae]NRF70787.1 ABC transporter substrate-binding protein [Aquabacterium terrae]
MGRGRVFHALAALLLTLAAAAPGARAQPLAIGLTAPLTGPDAAYGLGLRHGAQLAVARANASGGVAGRPLELLALDDGGDPQRAAANARQLLARGAVALTGVHGASATAAVAEVLAPTGGEPPRAALVGPATGAEPLRDPPRPGVFHLRAGVAEEASAALLHLDTLGVSRYALIARADAHGESGRERVLFELTRIATRPVASERLAERATPAEVGRLVDQVCALRPEAVILALDAVQARAALAAAHAQPCATHYLVFSEAGAALAGRPPGSIGPHPQAGLLVTQVVPHPGNALHPLVAEYQRALLVHGTAGAPGASGAPAATPGSHASLEAYAATQVIHEALRACGREAGRACLLQVLPTRTFELPGLKVQFGPAQRQPRPFVEITLLDGAGRLRR